MMYTSSKFESEEAVKSQVEPLQIQPRLFLGHYGRWWLSFQKLQQQFWREGWQSHKLCTRQRMALSNSSAHKRVKQATLRPIVFKQLATDARAPGTNFKHCGSDWLLHKLLTYMFWTVAMVPPVLVITPVHTGAPTHILLSAIATISMP